MAAKSALERDVIIFGYGRSGTTWIAQVVARAGMDLVFEPLFDGGVPEIAACASPYHDLGFFWYLKNGAVFEHEAVARAALTGEYRNEWTSPDRDEERPARKVVKVIRANLMVDWILERLPFNAVFVIRNPLAVVASAYAAGWYAKRKGYHVRADLPVFDGPLAEHADFIRGPLDQLEILATTWCINNYVPRQMGVFDRVPLVVYDELVASPVDGFLELAENLCFQLDDAAIAQIDVQSFTSGASRPASHHERSTAWKKHLTPADVDRVLAIVERFDLTEYAIV